MFDELEKLKSSGEYLTTYEIAEILNITTMTVSRWIRRGDLPGSYKSLGGRGGKWLIPRDSIVAFVEKAMNQQ
ncbi:MAG: helix-turn-helix domain-containing protein [Anaerolineales bacterium]|nr:helix-turn-helix domain-containing protein [Anaerolineales bacterium]